MEINYYGIDLDAFILKIKEIQPEIEACRIVHPKDFFQFLTSKNLHPFLLSALDCAYWDLFGKLENKSFTELNQLENKTLAESSFTISIADAETQIRKMEQSSWKKFKVKMNGLNRDDFSKLIQSGFEIALDANASFKEEDCLWLQENLDSRNLMYIEQPLEIGNFEN